ncbi:MAG: hypothetical protein ABIM36_03355 [candidate division WOR-3 bacterium]
MAFFFILIFLNQIEIKEKLFLEEPKKYRIFYFELRDKYLNNKEFEKLYKISKVAICELGKNYIFYSDFLISRYLTNRKFYSLIDSIDSFFEKEEIKRILFSMIDLKFYELAEKFIKYEREKNKDKKLFSDMLYRIYIEKNDYKNAFKELKNFENKEIIKVEIKRISKNIPFETIENEFQEEEFYPVLAEIAISKNLYEKGINYYIKSKDEKKLEEYLERNPDYIIRFTEKENDPLILYYKAKAFEIKGEKEKAKDIYEIIKDKVEKFNDEIYYSFSKIYLEKNEMGEAKKNIDKIKDRNKKLEVMGLYNILTGNFKENFEILKEIKSSDASFYLFLTHYFSKNFDKAETLSFKFISNFPKDKRIPEVLYLSYILKNFKENLNDYVPIHYKIFKGEDVEINLKGEKIDFLYSYLYGVYLKKKNKINESLKLFEKIKESDLPDIIKVKALIEIGEIYEKIDKNKAKEIYKEIILKYPENPFFPYIERKL